MKQIALDLVNAMEISIALGEYLGHVERNRAMFQHKQVNPERLLKLVKDLDNKIANEIHKEG